MPSYHSILRYKSDTKNSEHNMLKTPVGSMYPECPSCHIAEYVRRFEIHQAMPTPSIEKDISEGRLVVEYGCIVDETWECEWDCVTCSVKFSLSG